MIITTLPPPISVRLVAAETPPALPDPGQGCVGASPTVAAAPSWPLLRMAPSTVWPLAKGRGVRVAVVDSGVSRSAEGMAGALLNGSDVTGGGRPDEDCLGLGTALAGLIAARPTDGSSVVGLAPEASLIPVKAVDAEGTTSAQRLAAGIRAAVAAHADVIVVGMGLPGVDPGLRSAVRAAVAADIVVVAPVNDGTQSSGATNQKAGPWYPASDPSVLSVGGIGQAGVVVGGVAGTRLDLVAPSEGAISAGPVGGEYTVGGTAVAAAYTAGAAALLRAYRPQLDAAGIRSRLITASGADTGGLDLYAAVAGLERDTSPVEPVPAAELVLPARQHHGRDRFVALVVAMAALGVAAMAGVVRVVFSSGRRRRFRL